MHAACCLGLQGYCKWHCNPTSWLLNNLGYIRYRDQEKNTKLVHTMAQSGWESGVWQITYHYFLANSLYLVYSSDWSSETLQCQISFPPWKDPVQAQINNAWIKLIDGLETVKSQGLQLIVKSRGWTYEDNKPGLGSCRLSVVAKTDREAKTLGEALNSAGWTEKAFLPLKLWF